MWRRTPVRNLELKLRRHRRRFIQRSQERSKLLRRHLVDPRRELRSRVERPFVHARTQAVRQPCSLLRRHAPQQLEQRPALEASRAPPRSRLESLPPCPSPRPRSSRCCSGGMMARTRSQRHPPLRCPRMGVSRSQLRPGSSPYFARTDAFAPTERLSPSTGP